MQWLFDRRPWTITVTRRKALSDQSKTRIQWPQPSTRREAERVAKKLNDFEPRCGAGEVVYRARPVEELLNEGWREEDLGI